MTVAYVVGSVEDAKRVHDEIPDIKFIWRLVRFENFTELSLFKIESPLIPGALDHKLIKLQFDKLPDGKIAMTALLEEDQSLLAAVGVKEILPPKKRTPRKKKTDG
jgi:hypothetical protein